MIKSFLGASAIVAVLATQAQAQDLSPAQVERFTQFNEESVGSVDYGTFSFILQNIMFNAGPSDRRIERTRITTTGSRINRTNNSRYRTEANRIWFHTLEDIHKEGVSEYRQELEALYGSVPISDLNRDEQLAYWFNLHNAVLIDELIREYPVRRVDRVRVDGEPLKEAKIVNIEGGPISLDDIRTIIVPGLSDDPRTMYGFFTGSIGGPSLQTRAFSGLTVWDQLDRVGHEFVNALRGVDLSDAPVRISPLYFEAQERYFPNWPNDITGHLLRYADADVRTLINGADGEYRESRFEYSIADMTNGTLCGGGGYLYVRIEDGGPSSPSHACNPLPPETQRLIIDVNERRLRLFEAGELGRVIVRDIPTEDPDDPSR